MPDIADDLTDAGLEQLALHEQGRCDEIECQYCSEDETCCPKVVNTNLEIEKDG